MCGIVGYLGSGKATSFLINGLSNKSKSLPKYFLSSNINSGIKIKYLLYNNELL